MQDPGSAAGFPPAEKQPQGTETSTSSSWSGSWISEWFSRGDTSSADQPVPAQQPNVPAQAPVPDTADAEERRQWDELRNSKEWKESERHLLKVENNKRLIVQRAKQIAQERGFNPGRCEAVEDAAKHIAEDGENLPETQQLLFLVKFMRDLENPNSQSWERIEEEVKRWRSWED